MKSTRLILTAVLLAALPLSAADAIRMQTASASVTVEGTSTLHAWTVSSGTIDGWVEVPAELLEPAPGQEWLGHVRPGSRITIPARSLQSDHAKMTALMLKALKATTHPNIEFELTEVVSQKGVPGGVELQTRGTLTIAGKSRPIELPVEVRRDASGKVAIRGAAPVRMSEFGIRPPTAMLGTIRTGNDVNVKFEWIVSPSPAGSVSN
ncbi:MAG TPA: YceI family protein [Thermoanaerobaculia bacterium]|nr:YceI family protein [Thermoanaerobaculia bacterium]